MLKKIRRKLFADEELGEKICKHCNEKFNNSSSEFCSAECAKEHI